MFPHISIRYTRGPMGMVWGPWGWYGALGVVSGHSRMVWGPLGMVRTFKQFENSPSGGGIRKEPTWTFDVDYITQMNFSYVQLFAMLCVFSTIVQSYVNYIKHPHTLFRTVFVKLEVVQDQWDMSLPLVLNYQNLTGS